MGTDIDLSMHAEPEQPGVGKPKPAFLFLGSFAVRLCFGIVLAVLWAAIFAADFVSAATAMLAGTASIVFLQVAMETAFRKRET